MTRDELEREAEYNDLLDALTAAKQGGDREVLQQAKEAIFAFRQARRLAVDPDANPGEARPAAVKTGVKPAGGN